MMTGASAAKFFAEARLVLQDARDVTQVKTCLDSILSWLTNGDRCNTENSGEHDAALGQVQLYSRLMQQQQCTSSQLWGIFFWSSFSPMSHVLLTGELRLRKLMARPLIRFLPSLKTSSHAMLEPLVQPGNACGHLEHGVFQLRCAEWVAPSRW